jgi:hypothetical protein
VISFTVKEIDQQKPNIEASPVRQRVHHQNYVEEQKQLLRTPSPI